MKESDLHSLIVLQYLQMGIVPYYPGSGILTAPDKKTRRKFRKIWRKAARELDLLEILSSENKSPSVSLKCYRQSVVYNWIRGKILNAHKQRQK